MDTKEEQRIRREAAEFVLASIRLEGFTVPEKTLQDIERYILGEITTADLISEPYFIDDGEPLEIPTRITLPHR